MSLRLMPYDNMYALQAIPLHKSLTLKSVGVQRYLDPKGLSLLTKLEKDKRHHLESKRLHVFCRPITISREQYLDSPTNLLREQGVAKLFNKAKPDDYDHTKITEYQESTSNTVVDKRMAAHILSPYLDGFKLDFLERRFAVAEKSAAIYAVIERRREAFDVYPDGDDSIAYQIMLDTYGAFKDQQRSQFRRQVARLRTMRTIGPNSSCTTEKKRAINGVQSLIREHLDIFRSMEIPNNVVFELLASKELQSSSSETIGYRSVPIGEELW
ncbi:hypothetical protein Slin15195_G022170 [Septoria linicola]|uniref:Uncharacterized protein n=1 Tax=Septoria linicola TaxID=215465 RepID=A0A9Q9AMM4_9PEZI|nr:hypothetical protein Slin14017_G021200 [Septoria linicola]USW48898.1 hypothetical protein Slin15195_G022170 [Septoria linicola]